MPANILDGRAVADRLLDETASDVFELRERGVVPKLVVLLVGDDPASGVYVSHKQKQCSRAGIESRCVRMPADTTQDELLSEIKHYNQDRSVHGILVQLPLPAGMDREEVVNAVSPDKDVDGFHALNMGRIVHNTPRFLPCTPAAVQHILREYEIDLAGKHVVIINRSIVVGQPLALMLMQNAEAANATVTVCHDHTKNLRHHTRQADVLITAVGRLNKFHLSDDMIKEGAVVVDVAINRTEGGKLTGDVDFKSMSEKASWITPVPGGVGPVTVAMLLKNTVLAAKRQENNP